MITPAYKPFDLCDLIHKAHKGELVIPDFQRDLVWKPGQIVDLLVSILEGHYVGTLLLLEARIDARSSPIFRFKQVYGAKKTSSSPPYYIYILDGQQRTSAVHYAFTHPSLPLPGYRDPHRFFLKLDKLLSGRIEDAIIAENRPSEISLRIHEWEKGEVIPFGPMSGPQLITLSNLICCERGKEAELMEFYLKETKSPHEGKAAIITGKLTQLIRYTFHTIILSPSTSTKVSRLIGAITPIFVKINSKGTRLDLFDLAVATLYPILSPLNLRDELNNLASTHPTLHQAIEEGVIDPDDILRLIVLIMNKSLKTSNILGELKTIANKLHSGSPGSGTSLARHSFHNFKDLWDESVNCLQAAYERILKEYGALKPDWIPYTAMIVPLAALLHVVSVHHKPSGLTTGALREVDCWYWHSVFNERYEKSVNTTTERDAKEIARWIMNPEDPRAKPGWIDCAVPSGLNLKEVNKKTQALFKAVINLIALKGANKLIDGSPGPTHPSDLALDHLYPKSKYSGPICESVLNFTILDATTNKKKGKKSPGDFYLDIHAGHCTTGKSCRDTFESHLIGSDAEDEFKVSFGKMPTPEIEKFTDKREKDVLNAIHDKLKGCCPGSRGGTEGQQAERQKTEPGDLRESWREG